MTSPATPAPRPLTLSVLDLVPVREDQSSADAVAATLALARVADGAGYHRYWLAEHHNMPAVAATNPPVLVALVASSTGRMRVGSGGVMLPNHAPLVVAEQFALLEAAFPGRIDLGIGRAPGSDPVTSFALRHGAGGVEADAVQRFDGYVDDILAMLEPAGAALDLRGRPYVLRATPRATARPAVWLLGSSDYSARLAAAKGLPYVFAHHFAGTGTAEALALYRDGFAAATDGDRPRTFLTVNAVVAPTDAQAHRLALPQLRAMVRLRTGKEMQPLELVETAEEASPVDPQGQFLADRMRQTWVIGDPASAAARIRALAARFEVDEVMVNPVASAVSGTAHDRAPAREQTVQLLASALTERDERPENRDGGTG